MAEKHYLVVCRMFAVAVDTNEQGTIIMAAPIVRKFIGQPIENLLSWVRFKDWKFSFYDLDNLPKMKE